MLNSKKIVRLFLEEGRTEKSISNEFSVSVATISNWVRQFRDECQINEKTNDETEANIEWVKEAESHYKSNKAYLKTEGNLIFNITNKLLNQEADILAGKNIIINAGELDNTREGKEVDIELYFKRDYSYKKRGRIGGGRSNADFSTGIAYKQTLYADKPTQIIAGGNIIVNASKVGNGEYQEYVSGYTNTVKKVEKIAILKMLV